MSDSDFYARFLLAVLATWRVTHLLSKEDGPADLIARFREHLGPGRRKLMDCFYCLSFWVSAPLAFFVCRKPVEVVVGWLALSGGSCLLERIGGEPVVIQPIAEDRKEVGDGMLWAGTVGTERVRGGVAHEPAASATATESRTGGADRTHA